MSAAALLALAVVAQPGGERIDPALPDAVRPAVQSAIDAELDPKRGPSNAQAVLDAAMAKHQASNDLVLALRLRHAAIELRRILVRDDALPEPIRYEKAYTTFARLDLTDPGAKAWLERTLEHHPYAKKKLGKKAQRALKVALLWRGPDLDKKNVEKIFADAVEKAGFALEFVPLKKAEMILKVGAESTRSNDPSRRAARVSLGLESVRDGKIIWRHSLFRTESAKDLRVAIEGALDWLARIGGRDLLFRWLGERAFHTILEPGRFSVSTGLDLERGAADPHAGHGHAPERPTKKAPR